MDRINVLVTSIFMDHIDPLEIYIPSFQGVKSYFHNLERLEQPLAFEIDISDCEWLVKYVTLIFPNCFVLFERQGRRGTFLSQYYEPPVENIYKIFKDPVCTRRVTKRMAKLQQAQIEIVQYPEYKEEDHIAIAIPPEVVLYQPKKYHTFDESAWLDLQPKRIFTVSEEEELQEKLKGLKLTLTTFKKKYKFSAIISDLNEDKKCNQGLINALVFMALKSKMKNSDLPILDENLTDGNLESKLDLLSDKPKEQMSTKLEADSHGDEEVKIDLKGNVALSSQREDSKPIPPVVRSLGFLPNSSATEIQTLERLTSRWIEVGHYVWSTQDKRFGDLTNTPITLPLQALKVNQNSPNIMPFNVHQFARFDMTVRIQVNSNKFQIGMLQANWLYSANINQNVSLLDNVFSASQRIHGLVSAGSSNDILIKIPYWALTAAISLKKFSSEPDFYTILDLGKLYIKVLNQLKVSAGVTNEVGVTVWLSLENIEFRGMKASNLDKPFEQMDVVETMLGTAKGVTESLESGLKQLKMKSDCDEPPLSSIPIVMQPVAAHSFSITDGQPCVNEILRAQPLNQTPSVPGSKLKDQTIRDLLDKWSFFETIKWNTADKRGKSLWVSFSSPDSLTSNEAFIINSVVTRPLTILNFLARYFRYWRGELELRFDFVANSFYSGRVAIYTIPGEGNDVVYDEARQSAGMIFDLQEGHQFIYKIPFYSNIPFIPTLDSRNYNLSFIPSATKLFVINPLAVSDNIPNEIEINLYIRGSSSFEFALLKTPDISVFYNKDVHIPASNAAHINPDWAQAFTSGSRWMRDSSGDRLSLFYNQTTDYFTLFNNLNFGKVYSVPQSAKNRDNTWNHYFIGYYTKDSKGDYYLNRITFIARCYQYTAYPVCVCFKDQESATAYAEDKDFTHGIVEAKQGPWLKFKTDSSESLEYPKTDKEMESWSDATYSMLPTLDFVELKSSTSWELIPQSQGDERLITEMPSISLAKPSVNTDSGNLVFGENQTTIKGMCRRFQFLGCQTISTSSNSTCLSSITPSLILSTHPIRRFESSSPNDRDNITREGFISTLASMYAGYRGSIRYKLILSDWNTDTSATIAVVHKFDEPFQPQLPSVYKPGKVSLNFNNVLDSSYAMKLQCSQVNPVVEFEIPFYNPGEYNSLYIPPVSNTKLIRHLMESGQVRVYISTVKQAKVSVDVWYSLADDMELAVFQGIPAVVKLDPLGQSDETLLPESQGLPSFGLDLITKIASTSKALVNESISVPKSINTASAAITTTASNMTEVLTSSSEKVVNMFESLKSGFKKLLDLLPGVDSIFSLMASLASMGGIMCSAFIQLIYVLISPSVATISIACCSILCLLIGVNVKASEMCKDLILYLTSWINTYLGSTPSQQNEESDGFAKTISLLWSIICGSLSFSSTLQTNAKPNFSSLLKGLFSNSANTFRTHNFGVRFFSDFFECIKRMYDWINAYLGRSYPIFNTITNDEIKTWLIESTAILDANVETKTETDNTWVMKLFELQARGSVILATARASKNYVPSSSLATIEKLFKQLNDKVGVLNRTNNYAPFRKEPFVIWLYSKNGGTGKSKYAEDLITKLAKKNKISPAYFKLTAGQQYFDGLTTEKFILLDDFLATQDQNSGTLLSQFLQMVGSSKLQLPRADVARKLTYDDFEFVIVTSNFADFQAENVARCKDAFERRRHIIIEFEGTSYVDRKFKVHMDRQGQTQIMSNDEVLEYIYTVSSEFRLKQNKLFHDQMLAYNEALNSVDCSSSVEEYLKYFKEKVKQFSDLAEWANNWIPSLISVPETKTETSEIEKVIENIDLSKLNKEQMNEAIDKVIPLKTTAKDQIDEISLKFWQKHLSESEREKKPDLTKIDVIDILKLEETKSKSPSIFKKNPFISEVHQDDFELNFKNYKTTIFNGFGTGYVGSCKCADLDHPYFLRFDLIEFYRFLDVKQKELSIDDIIIEHIKIIAPYGIYIDFTGGVANSTWALCRGFVPMNETIHIHLANRCWSIVFRHVSGTNGAFDMETLKQALPAIMHPKLEEIEKVSGWKLVVDKSKVGTFSSMIRQVFGLWPKTLQVGYIKHPMPQNSDEPIVRSILNPTMGERFHLMLGAIPVKCKTYGSDTWLYPQWMAIIKMIASSLSCILLMMCVTKLFMTIITFCKASNPVEQMLTSGVITPGRKAATIATKARSLLGFQHNGEEETFVSHDDLEIDGKPISGRLKKVLKNSCYIVAKILIDGEYRYNKHGCLGIFNSKVAMCNHYIDHFKRLKLAHPSAEFYLLQSKINSNDMLISWKTNFDPDLLTLYKYGNENGKLGDLVLADFGNIVHNFLDIRKFMPSSKGTYYPTYTTLLKPQKSGNVTIYKITSQLDTEPLTIGSQHDEEWIIGSRLVYNVGGPGMCGAIVWHEESQFPLLGFHTAGIGCRVGYSELLIREEYFLHENGVQQAEPNMDIQYDKVENLKGDFEIVGTLSTGMKPHIPRSTRIIPSLAFGLFETHTQPAPLSKSDPRLKIPEDPLYVGLMKRSVACKPFLADDIYRAKRDVVDKFMAVKPITKFRKLSVKEAIEGLPELPRSKPIEMCTSEGYPWVKLRPKGYSNKSWLFNYTYNETGEMDLHSIDKFLEDTLEIKERMRKRGVVPVTYYTAMLKDARILKSKVYDASKTRVFEMSPIDLTIVQRQFQLPFLLTYMENRHIMENTVGININGKEWNDLAMDLILFSDKILAGDFKSFGPTLDQNIVMAGLEIIQDVSMNWAWWNMASNNIETGTASKYHHYEDWGAKAEWDVLNKEIVNSPLVCEDIVVRPPSGLASGNIATVILNSLGNSVQFRCIYLELARRYAPQFATLYYFNEFVKCNFNGDDSIIAVKDKIISWFNNVTISEQFAKHNIVYTNSKKDGTNPPFESIYEVTYLKCYFVNHPFRYGCFLAAPDKASIEDCCQWIWKSEIDKLEATIVNCEQAVRLAYGQGIQYFGYIRNKIRKWLISNGVQKSLPTWMELDSAVWDRGEQILDIDISSI